MASRYGRNKRRVHREEIARLTESLCGPWARTRIGLPEIDREIVTEVVQQHRKSRHGIEKTATLTMQIGSMPSMLREAMSIGRVNYDGFEWAVMSVECEPTEHASFEVSMSLVGLSYG